MKKVLALILALCMAFALAVPAYAADEEVSGPLVLYSSMTEFDLEALETCFNEVYPDVEIEVVSGSVGEYTSRIAAEADNPQGDVTWGGLCDSDGMTHEALFEKWVSIHNDEAMEGYSTPNGFYSMDHLSTVCFCVNTELEEELGLDIRSYQDLLDPALKGKIESPIRTAPPPPGTTSATSSPSSASAPTSPGTTCPSCSRTWSLWRSPPSASTPSMTVSMSSV